MKQDVMNPLTWNTDQWEDALVGFCVGGFAFAMIISAIIVFH